MTPNDYCLQYTPTGSSRYYSLFKLPVNLKNQLLALYAFECEIKQIPQQCTEVAVAEAKLRWWQEQIELLFSKQQATHPILQALLPSIATTTWRQADFQSVIAGYFLELQTEQYEKRAALIEHAQHTHGAFYNLLAVAAGASNDNELQAAQDLGLFMRFAEIILQLRGDLQHHQLRLSIDDCTQHTIDLTTLFHYQQTPALSSLLAIYHQQAQQFLHSALTTLNQQHHYKTYQPLLILAAITQQQLALYEDDDYGVLTHYLDLTPWQKVWRAYRTWQKICRSQRRKMALIL